MGRVLVRGNSVVRRIAPAFMAALIAIAAAAAGFHELPNVFQLVSTLVAAILAAVATRDLKKIPLTRDDYSLPHGALHALL